jgi:hypothetical protein
MDESVKVLIERTYRDEQTEGRIYTFNERSGIVWDGYTLELPELGNQRSISCIPEGEYPVIKHNSPTFGECFWIKEVPNRSEILIHVANYVGTPNPRTGMADLRGCIGVGKSLLDFTGDKIAELTSSKKAINEMLSVMKSSFTIEIRKRHDYRSKKDYIRIS